VHAKYNESTALLAGDIMLLQSYEYLNETDPGHSKILIRLLNKTGREVCEGQQLDMDFENTVSITPAQYMHMIELKTAVLLAASLQMGALIGGASASDQEHIYSFGKNLGLAFQVQDDWLDSFGDPARFGKQKGGDIISNKKTFLLVNALTRADHAEEESIRELLTCDDPDKVERMIAIYRQAGIGEAAQVVKKNYMDEAYAHLERIAVPPANKTALTELAVYLLERET
jgi:geranylgeranyl diphosphate synthase type II